MADFSNFECHADANRPLKVTGGLDTKGNPAPLDGPPVFESTDPSLCTFTADPNDPNIGIVSPIGPLSAGVGLTITADVKIGPEVKNVVAQGMVVIIPGEAQGFSVEVGEETPQAAAAPTAKSRR